MRTVHVMQFKHLQRMIALGMIAIYQKWISPRKGYRCAYAAWSGEASCSDFCKKAIQEHGIAKGFRLLRLRFYQCRLAAAELQKPVLAMAAGGKTRKATSVDGNYCVPHTVHERSGCHPCSKDKVLTNDCKPCDRGKIAREDRCGCGTFKTSGKARWRDRR